ncbi:MAG: ELWxxDGT repeat protein, partial [Cyanobacteriota bacterium]|nr:ELWxxDGT repeat protein [Cyanobacteriota bacterium]
IRPGLTSSSPEELTVVGDTLYFTASSDSGRQLYAIESSVGKFQSAARIPKPKPVSSAGRKPQGLANIDGQLYFSAESDLGRELWSAKGSKGKFIADINPGGRSSSPGNFTRIQTLSNQKKSSSMFFTATDGERGIEIWRLPLNQKDPKPERYADIFAGPSSSDPRKLLNSDQVLFFSASDGSLGRELWTLGPSIKGPTGLPGSGSSKIRISEGESFVYRFTTDDGGDEQWRINGGLDSALFNQKKMKKKGELFFKQPPNYERPKDSESDNIYEVVVRATEPSTNLSSDQYIYVEVLDEREGGPGDGDVIEDINTEEIIPDSENSDTDFDNQSGKTTTLVKNIKKGSSGSNPSGLEVLNESLYFSADNGKSGSELWTSDGTSTSTRLVRNINPGKKSSSPSSLISFNQNLYFSADDGKSGTELWTSNGTKDGTKRVADINPGPSSSNPSNMTTLDGALLFAADDGQDGQELWKYDRSNDKPTQIKNINSNSSSLPRDLTKFDQKVYFSAEGNIYGRELWVSNGSNNGTKLFHDIYPGGLSSDPQDITTFKDNLYFTAVSFGGRQVWKSNGSQGGTNKISPISSQQIFSDVEELTATPDRLFYTAQTSIQSDEETDNVNQSNDSTTNEDTTANTDTDVSAARRSIGRELWTSKGSADSMKLVLDIYEGPGSSDPTELTAIGNKIYFSADDGANGEELWVSDGTDFGTQRLTDINPGAKNASPRDITALDDSIYFTAINEKTGRELWRLSESGNSRSLARVVQTQKGSRSMRAAKRTKDEFVFNLAKEFGHNKADRIINFKTSDGDQIHLDKEIFGLSGKPIDLVTVSSNRQLKAQQSQPSQFIYFEPKGQLYFDRNDEQTGYGKNAGLFAVLKGGPDLTESDFKLI